MQAEIQSFTYPTTNQSVRVMDQGGSLWFVAKDQCDILGYANPRDAISKHCKSKGVAKCDILTAGGKQEVTIIDEANLNRLIMRSNAPNAEPYQDWVCEEVLPTIRKTGSYQAAPIETQLNNPAALRGILLSYTEKVLALEAQVAEQAPKVAALQRLEMADGSVCLTNAAKLLKVRPKDFFLHLQAKKWIYKRPGTSTWVAYQDRIQFGLLEMSEFTQTLPDGTEKLRVQTRLTPKGLAKLSFEFNGADQQAN